MLARISGHCSVFTPAFYRCCGSSIRGRAPGTALSYSVPATVFGAQSSFNFIWILRAVKPRALRSCTCLAQARTRHHRDRRAASVEPAWPFPIRARSRRGFPRAADCAAATQPDMFCSSVLAAPCSRANASYAATIIWIEASGWACATADIAEIVRVPRPADAIDTQPVVSA